jgi:hypothetical protein
MAEIREKIEAELENIEQVLAELKQAEDLDDLSALKLAGTGAFIHNFYNGVEKYTKTNSNQ